MESGGACFSVRAVTGRPNSKKAASAEIVDHVRDLLGGLVPHAFPVHTTEHHAPQKPETENCRQNCDDAQPQPLVIGGSTAKLAGGMY